MSDYQINQINQIDQNLIQEQKLEFLELNDKEWDLKRLIQEIIEKLKKYKWFSLKYKIEESDNVKLNSLIEAEYKRFNDRFPWFLKDPQDMINFFRYQRSILISETLANLEKKYWKRIEYILWIGSIKWLQSYLKDNKETFADHKWHKVPIKLLFLSKEYYKKNYRKILDEFWVELPADPVNYFNHTREYIKHELWLNEISFEELKEFINKHKDNTFTDYTWKIANIINLFDSEKYYESNYENVNEEFLINLPKSPTLSYRKSWSELKHEFWLQVNWRVVGHNEVLHRKFNNLTSDLKNFPIYDEEIESIIRNEGIEVLNRDDFFSFFKQHKNETFVDLEWNNVPMFNIFSSYSYFEKNIKIIEANYWIKFPTFAPLYYDITRGEIRDKLWLPTFHGFKTFFKQHKNETFMDLEWNEVPILNIFSDISYYQNNIMLIKKKYWIDVPESPSEYFELPRDKLKEEVYDNLMEFKEFVSFFIKHQNSKFIDVEWNNVSILKLFSDSNYYQKNYQIVRKKYWAIIPWNPCDAYNTYWNEMALNIMFIIIKKKTWLFSSLSDFKEFCDYPWNLTVLENVNKFNYYKWVFCDVDWTLILNETEVNEKVVNLLLSLYNKWLNITLRTAGDVQKKIKLLEWNLQKLIDAWLTVDILSKMWIRSLDGNRNLKNKYNYKNSIVELVIDDRHNKRFMYQVGIIPQKYVEIWKDINEACLLAVKTVKKWK